MAIGGNYSGSSSRASRSTNSSRSPDIHAPYIKPASEADNLAYKTLYTDFTPQQGDTWIKEHLDNLEILRVVTTHGKFTAKGATLLYNNLSNRFINLLNDFKNNNILPKDIEKVKKLSQKIDDILRKIENSNITPEYIKKAIDSFYKIIHSDFTPKQGDNLIKEHPDNLEILKLVAENRKFTDDGTRALLKIGQENPSEDAHLMILIELAKNKKIPQDVKDNLEKMEGNIAAHLIKET